MPKYYKKKYYYPSSRDKYSVEQQSGVFELGAAGSQAVVQIVPDTAIQGMRKVKHLTVSIAGDASGGAGWWALVYVPQGTSPNTLNLTGTTGMYEPNQFVMNCGTYDAAAGPVRFHSPVSRNLNSGDRIYLILANADTVARNYIYCVRYAITLQ